VDSRNIGNLSKIITEAIIAKDVLHPILEKKMSKILENLAHAFITSGNPSGKEKGNQNFHAEFTDLLKQNIRRRPQSKDFSHSVSRSSSDGKERLTK